jgi:hypothetical protein
MILALQKITFFAFVTILALAAFEAQPAAAMTQSPGPAASANQVLPLIEKFKAPPHPKSTYIDRETYDYRIMYKSPVPPTLTDAFICDIWQRITLDLKLTLSPQDVSEQNIKDAMNIYLNKDWNDIAGYRPWTHWNFIRRLKEPQRDLLAKEVVAYINKNGVRDVKE